MEKKELRIGIALVFILTFALMFISNVALQNDVTTSGVAGGQITVFAKGKDLTLGTLGLLLAMVQIEVASLLVFATLLITKPEWAKISLVVFAGLMIVNLFNGISLLNDFNLIKANHEAGLSTGETSIYDKIEFKFGLGFYLTILLSVLSVGFLFVFDKIVDQK